jgi:predicted type IV restriction endonuclease
MGEIVSKDFRAGLIEQAKRSVAIAPHCRTEEATKLSLIAPFIDFLGYDSRNPAEVMPEHHADFADRFKNRVDFAVLQDGQPVIAIECKSVGEARIDDRGQLRAYFNAAKTVKLGVLTDGLMWEFYADSDEPNLMDDVAFLVLDLRKVAEGQLPEQTVEGLQQLRKGDFSPENIGAEAKRKLIFKSFTDQISQLMEQPDEQICRKLLEGAGLKHIRSKALSDFQEMARDAFKAVIDARILARLDIKPVEAAKGSEAPPPPPKAVIEEQGPNEAELRIFDWVKRRLAYLVRDEKLFEAIEQLAYHAYHSKFVIHFGGERKGRVLDFVDAADGWRFLFPNLDQEIVTSDLTILDEPLLGAFTLRVSGAGQSGAARLA